MVMKSLSGVYDFDAELAELLKNLPRLKVQRLIFVDDNTEEDRVVSFLKVDSSFLTLWNWNRDQGSMMIKGDSEQYMKFQPGSFFSEEHEVNTGHCLNTLKPKEGPSKVEKTITPLPPILQRIPLRDKKRDNIEDVEHIATKYIERFDHRKIKKFVYGF